LTKIKYAFFSALAFGAFSNFLFFGPHEWKESLSATGPFPGSAKFEVISREVDLPRIKNFFRNTSPGAAVKEKDLLLSASAEEEEIHKDDWKLIGSILEKDVRKAFIISSKGQVQEIGIGDSFGFNNEAFQIEEKSIVYLNDSGQKKVLRLYENQELGGEDEKD